MNTSRVGIPENGPSISAPLPESSPGSKASDVTSNGSESSEEAGRRDAVGRRAAVFSASWKLGDAMKSVSQSMRNTSVPSMPGRTEKLPETLHRGTDGHLHADMTGLAPEGKLP